MKLMILHGVGNGDGGLIDADEDMDLGPAVLSSAYAAAALPPCPALSNIENYA